MVDIYYKYRSDSNLTEQIFVNGKVYLSTAKGMNDPFECSLQEIGHDWIASKVKEMKQAAVSGFLISAVRFKDANKNFYGYSGTQIEEILQELHGCPGVEEMYSFYVDFIKRRTGHSPSDCNKFFSSVDAQLDAVGIFSLSSKPDHPLMWAHYAGEHSGICIGFEPTAGSRLADSEHFLQVQYSDDLPILDEGGFKSELTMSADEQGRIFTSSFKIAFSDKTFQAAMTTKPTCWSYESEWRYVEPYPGLFEWPGRISELTFGLKCSDERRNHFIQLAEEHVTNPVRLFEIQKRYGTNSLDRISFEKEHTIPRSSKRVSANLDVERSEMTPQEFAAKMERLIRQEKYGDALFQIEENLKTNPGDPILLFYQGVAYGYSKRPDKAFECFKQLVTQNPEVSQAWYQMSCALVELGRNEEAVGALRKAISLDPNDASTAFNLGLELYKADQSKEEVLKYLRLAERLGHRRARQAIALVESN